MVGEADNDMAELWAKQQERLADMADRLAALEAVAEAGNAALTTMMTCRENLLDADEGALGYAPESGMPIRDEQLAALMFAEDTMRAALQRLEAG